MTTELRFDVAISCAEEDSWIARDLHNLVLRHSGLLKADSSLLERERSATRTFAVRSLGQQLDGYWFPLRKGDIEIPTIYSPTYDAFLNQQPLTA